jgi:NADPH-ferrihemoprotein reductase
VAEMDEYDPEHLVAFPKGKFAVFMTSTYGEGDPPDNVVDFSNCLEKMKKNGVKLDGLRYLAIGMGNKNYKHYNQTIKVGLYNQTASS